jgi:TctA family transporter
MIPFGGVAVWTSAKTLKVSRCISLPDIVIFCFMGSCAINKSFFDSGVMLAMGTVRFLSEANGFPVASVVLGLAPGPTVEQDVMVSLTKTQ